MAIGHMNSGGHARRLAMAVSAIALLAGCAEDGTQLFKPASDTTVVTSGGSTRLVERDVEAPEVFQATEAGLWDGRPSLGGVWVAHPDVTEPERVLIRNTSNAKFVIGALFKPSLERPGPRFQVSSDAADALGMLAGQPTNLNVTALRREEVPGAKTEPEPPAETPVSAAAMPAPEEVETATLDPVAGAATAIARAEGAAPAANLPVAAAEIATPAPKKRRWFWQKKEEEVAPVAVAEAPVPSPAPAAVPRASPTAPVANSPKPVSKLDRPYLQIGIFSVEENARNTAVAMRQTGIIPAVLKQSSRGKTFWRVIVGPATTASERAELLNKIKAAGFTDAYAVTN